MFVNCPHCQALIATDPATDRPPQRCPRCAAVLREPDPLPPAPATEPDAAPSRIDMPPATSLESPPGPSNDRSVEALTETTIETIAEALTEAPTTPPAETATPEDMPAATRLDDAPDAIVEAMNGPAAVEVELAPDTQPADDAGVATDANQPASAEPPLPSTRTSDAPAAAPSAARTASAAHGASRHAPSFARGARTVSARAAARHWGPPAAIAGLLLVFALQLLLADRARLAGDARWRPLLAGFCGALRCTLPPWREPSAFTLLHRDVRPHPSVRGALRVQASFRNDARWPQPWPRLQLTLSDVNGRAAGTRAFVAREYLGGAPTQAELAPGQSATVSMDVMEPAADMVAFTFDFH